MNFEQFKTFCKLSCFEKHVVKSYNYAINNNEVNYQPQKTVSTVIRPVDYPAYGWFNIKHTNKCNDEFPIFIQNGSKDIDIQQQHHHLTPDKENKIKNALHKLYDIPLNKIKIDYCEDADASDLYKVKIYI
jgi:hypothetical protein